MPIDEEAPAAAAQFTLSELEFLRGGIDSNSLQSDSERKILGKAGGQSVKLLLVALLADEQAGSLQLTAGTEKKLFGLRHVQAVMASATDKAPSAAEGTWEARLYQHLKAKNKTLSVEQLVYDLTPYTEDPWNAVWSLTVQGLDNRGLVQWNEKTTLKIFHSKQWSIPETTKSLAAQQPMDEIDRLLNQTKSSRPAMWDLLLQEISKGIKRSERTEDTGPSDFGSD